MKISSVLLAVSLILLSGCSRTVISPRCNFTYFTKNNELNKIAISVQVNDARLDSGRYFIHDWPFKMWEENSTQFQNSQWISLSKPSAQLLQESLLEAFQLQGYNVSQNSPVVTNCELLKILYSHGSGESYFKAFAEIETNIVITKQDQIIFRKTYKNLRQTPVGWVTDQAEGLLSECLTALVRDIVLDRDIENALRNAYGIPAQNEQVNIPKVDERPKFQDSPEQEKGDSTICTGTGFAICENGYILTAHHVVEKATSIYVKFQDTEWLPATIIQKSLINDVAILKVDRNTKHFFAISDKLRQGEKIFTLGYPVPGLLGEEPKYTEGTVSSLTGIVDEASLMQISVPLQPGNSGGPLLNEKAEVVGMATSVARVESFYKATGTLPQNVNWGVKAAFIKPLLPADCVNSELPNEKTEIDPIEIARNAVCLIKAETK